MNYTLGELVDRLTILELKQERQADWSDTNQIELVRKAIAEWNVERKSPSPDLVRDLKRVNGLIWDLESDIRLGKEDVIGLEEVGRRALAIRDLNERRIALRNRINAGQTSEQKHTSNLENVVPPLDRDIRWLPYLYQRIDSEIGRAKQSFDSNLNWAILVSLGLSAALIQKPPLPIILVATSFVFVVAFFARAGRAYNALINHAEARDLVDQFKLDLGRRDSNHINQTMKKIKDRLYRVEQKHRPAYSDQKLIAEVATPEFLLLLVLHLIGAVCYAFAESGTNWGERVVATSILGVGLIVFRISFLRKVG